jgi:hypothetical protein
MNNPDAAQKLHRALGRLLGVYDVSSSLERLDDVAEADFDSDARALLPHGALRRTSGGLPDEAYFRVEFWLTPDEQGWRSLEFVAWFVRDQALGGAAIQLRPFALAPTAGDQVQLGGSLCFLIDLFLLDAGTDPQAHLDRIGRLADDLVRTANLYHQALCQRGDRGILG